MPSTEPNTNICLVFEQDIEAAFTNIAQDYFSGIADGYCLKRNAVFPHITLSQFHITSDDFSTLKTWGDKQDIALEVSIGALSFRVGTGRHKGKEWIEYPVIKTPELIELQKYVCEQSGFTPLTALGDLYHPHITLARMDNNVHDIDQTERSLKAIIPPPSSIQVKLIVGHSDANGQLLSY